MSTSLHPCPLLPPFTLLLGVPSLLFSSIFFLLFLDFDFAFEVLGPVPPSPLFLLLTPKEAQKGRREGRTTTSESSAPRRSRILQLCRGGPGAKDGAGEAGEAMLLPGQTAPAWRKGKGHWKLTLCLAASALAAHYCHLGGAIERLLSW